MHGVVPFFLIELCCYVLWVDVIQICNCWCKVYSCLQESIYSIKMCSVLNDKRFLTLIMDHFNFIRDLQRVITLTHTSRYRKFGQEKLGYFSILGGKVVKRR